MDRVVKNMRPKVVAIIQARMGSTRLAGKVMMDLAGKTALSRVIDRVKEAGSVKGICVATSVLLKDDVVADEAHANGVSVYRGSEEDVLARYLGAAEMTGADHIVRVTADNPLTDPEFIDMCVKSVAGGKIDYAAMKDIPYGTGAEVFTRDALLRAAEKATREEREHVTIGIYNKPDLFWTRAIEPSLKLRRPDIRLTMDTAHDYDVLSDIFKHFTSTAGKIKLRFVIDYLDEKKGR